MFSSECSTTNQAKIIALRQNRGSEMKSLLIPPPTPPPVPLVPKKIKVVPKNHQREYRSTLRDIQNRNNLKKKEQKIQDEEEMTVKLRRMSQFKNVSSRVFCSAGNGEEQEHDDHDNLSCLTSSISSIIDDTSRMKNYVLMNKLDAVRSRRPKDAPKEEIQFHENYGKVPDYVQKRKEELNEIKRLRDEAEQAPLDIIPNGK